MNDPTEPVRRALVAVINHEPGSREALEADFGEVWSTDELREQFDVTGFAAPFVAVTRKSDGTKGSLMFQHHPRFYFTWKAS